MARWFRLPWLSCWGSLGDEGWAVVVPRLPTSGVGHRRHHLSSDATAADAVVSSDLVRDQSEEWDECHGRSARSGPGKLPHGLALS